MNIAFDVDDTLIIHEPMKETYPDIDMLKILWWYIGNKDTVFVWSGGGVDYAEQWCRKLGIYDVVTVIAKEKPQTLVIDLAYDDWESCLATTTILVQRTYCVFGEPTGG